MAATPDNKPLNLRFRTIRFFIVCLLSVTVQDPISSVSSRFPRPLSPCRFSPPVRNHSPSPGCPGKVRSCFTTRQTCRDHNVVADRSLLGLPSPPIHMDSKLKSTGSREQRSSSSPSTPPACARAGCRILSHRRFYRRILSTIRMKKSCHFNPSQPIQATLGTRKPFTGQPMTGRSLTARRDVSCP